MITAECVMPEQMGRRRVPMGEIRLCLAVLNEALASIRHDEDSLDGRRAYDWICGHGTYALDGGPAMPIELVCMAASLATGTEWTPQGLREAVDYVLGRSCGRGVAVGLFR